MNKTISLNWKIIDSKSIELNSPYAVYAGEIMEKILPKNSKRVDLREIQGQIIYAIDKFLVLTSRMITSYLKFKGYNVEQKQIQKELAFMSDNCYLNKYEFRTKDSKKSSFKCYTIGAKGNGFLKSMTGLRGHMLGYLDKCSPTQVKKILAANQALIELNLMNNSEMSVAKMIVDEGFHLFENKYLFRATGISENENSITILEPVRNDPDYKVETLKKLDRIEKTLGRSKCSVDSSKKITLIIVAEDVIKMQTLMNLIDETKYSHFSVLYTYDTLLYSDCGDKLYRKTLDRSMVELVGSIAA